MSASRSISASNAGVGAECLQLGAEDERRRRTSRSRAASRRGDRGRGAARRSVRSHTANANMPLDARQRAVETPRVDRLDQHLGVGVAAELVADAGEVGGEVGGVVDLAVVGEHVATRRRLPSAARPRRRGRRSRADDGRARCRRRRRARCRPRRVPDARASWSSRRRCRAGRRHALTAGEVEEAVDPHIRASRNSNMVPFGRRRAWRSADATKRTRSHGSRNWRVG